MVVPRSFVKGGKWVRSVSPVIMEMGARGTVAAFSPSAIDRGQGKIILMILLDSK
jgi:hypothetical protein